MLQSPVPTATTHTEGRSSQREADMWPYVEAKHKAAIRKALDNDRAAIKAARLSATSDPKFDLLTPEQKEAKMQCAAEEKLQWRKDNDCHASCTYSEFANYVSPHVYGKTAYGELERKEKKAFFERQIAALRLEHYASGGRPRHRHDDGEDDEEPIPQKQEGEIKREFSDIPAAEYTEPHEARASRGRARTHIKEHSEDEDSEEGIEEDDSEDGGSDEDDTTQVRHGGAQTGGARNANAEESDSEDEAAVPLVAVSRGMPLPEDAAMPALKEVNLKQRFATGIRCVEQAVIRGQVPTQGDSNKSNSKKRESERDGRERYGGSFGATKRAKVEVAI